MRKISVFNFMTLDGYYKGPNEDISWHKQGVGEEEQALAAEGSKSESVLLFGRVTFEMMESYWPTPMAMQQNKEVAEGMNASEKIVFSRTLKKTDWKNTRIVKDNMVEEVRRLKKEPGKDITILGSGTIITQLAEYALIDSYQFLVDPVVLGEGTSIFKGIEHRPELKLTDSKSFKSGALLLTYQQKKK